MADIVATLRRSAARWARSLAGRAAHARADKVNQGAPAGEANASHSTQPGSHQLVADGLPAGQVLGRYRIERPIGQGAVGRVFLAQDQSSGRWVALKTFTLDGAPRSEEDMQARERFLREAQTMRRLAHPGIVAVLDAGQTGSVAWIAMEPVAGADLRRYTKPARLLPVPLVVQIGTRVAQALAHAHACGVVHRDVKPANILVDLAGDAVKLTDFGIARLAEHSQTRSGLALGSPDYMSPEQLAGAEVGPAADLYALGATLFELLAGRRPYQADTLGALLRAVASDPVPQLQTLRPELPAALCAEVTRSLAKSPSERQPDATQMAQALERAGHGGLLRG